MENGLSQESILKRILNIEPGNKVDVLDKLNIWCLATVNVIIEKENEKLITVHYDGWGEDYNETISLNTQRIAPEGYFTRRKGNLIKIF